jgi:excisionase family DNA binding protein
MTKSNVGETLALDQEQIYTPDEVAILAKCSAGFVRKEIRNGNLAAFRLGGKLIRIKGHDAWEWLTRKSVNTVSVGSLDHHENSPKVNGVPSGAARKTVVDTALASVWRKERA